MSGLQEVPRNVLNESRFRKEKYKELLDMGAEIAEQGETDSIVATLRKVTALMGRSNNLSAEVHTRDRANNTSEVFLDTQVLKMSYELTGNALSKAAAAEFNEDEYANAIRGIIGKEDDWAKLTPYFLKSARIFNPVLSMMGTFKLDAPPVETTQKERRQRVRNELTQQVQPLTQIPRATDETKRVQFLNVFMKRLNKLLQDNDNEPIPYYKLICDPDSFPHTIDNIFQLSFLFRDGLVSFDHGRDGLPTVTLATATQKKNKDSYQNHQFISSMDPPLWERMIALYNITEPMLKINREE